MIVRNFRLKFGHWSDSASILYAIYHMAVLSQAHLYLSLRGTMFPGAQLNQKLRVVPKLLAYLFRLFPKLTQHRLRVFHRETLTVSSSQGEDFLYYWPIPLTCCEPAHVDLYPYDLLRKRAWLSQQRSSHLLGDPDDSNWCRLSI